ncbi:MAG: sodium:proton antiporter [Hydrococcus sp. SU_1_0]|nr:sodium:proton antiporter [Hydrococcus sp. SU_1_0]
MSIILILVACILLLLSYVFDISSKHTKIPAIILLLIMGWATRQIVNSYDIDIPDFSTLLPIFGTVGLILIVLEGGLELEINLSKISVIKQASLAAFLPMLFLVTSISILMYYAFSLSVYESILNAVPFCIISSAIAIPSSSNLRPLNKEFVTYESSLSDIFGVIFFNFVLANQYFSGVSIVHFLFELILMILISFIASALLSILLKKLNHHVKFIPIMIMIVLVYALSKLLHLPALLFILILGLFLNNLDELKRFKFIKWLNPDVLDGEIHKFKELVIEMTFLVKTVFFILFGFLINTADVLNIEVLPISSSLVGIFIVIRIIQLKLMKLPLMPLLFIAPRGLITILLFISIPVEFQLRNYGQSLMIQTILMTILLMMFGLMFNNPKDTQNEK